MCFSRELKHFQIEEHDFWQSEFAKQWYVLSFLRISKPVVVGGRESVRKLPSGSVTDLLSLCENTIKTAIKEEPAWKNSLTMVERSLVFDWEMHLFRLSYFLLSCERWMLGATLCTMLEVGQRPGSDLYSSVTSCPDVEDMGSSVGIITSACIIKKVMF